MACILLFYCHDVVFVQQVSLSACLLDRISFGQYAEQCLHSVLQFREQRDTACENKIHN